MLRIGGGHRWRKALFAQGIRQGFLVVDEIELALPPGLLTAAEKWLLYFSLASSDIELRDRHGNVLSLEEAAPGHRVFTSRGRRPLDSFTHAEISELLDADHFA